MKEMIENQKDYHHLRAHSKFLYKVLENISMNSRAAYNIVFYQKFQK